ncbi:codanin-1 isoform X1 [Hydra vulgaris]|nr:codanin-1 [Hydra vulgaris]
MKQRMAENILSAVFSGEIDVAYVCNAIKNRTPVVSNGFSASSSEFIEYFLAYLHEKASPANHIHYQSPKRIIEKNIDKNESKVLPQNRSKKKCVQSLSYSSPMKVGSTSPSQISSDFFGVSPIKSNDSSDKKKYSKRNSFELSNFDDFPSISMTKLAKQVKPKGPRRITTTPVAIGNSSSPELVNSSCFDTSNSLAVVDESMNKLFVDDKRFSRTSTLLQSVTNSEVNKEFSKCFLLPPELSEKDVHNTWALNIVVELYIFVCSQNLVTNFTLEFFFLFSTLTIQTKQSKFSFPFDNLAGCVYFAVNSLCKLKSLLVHFDIKTLQLLAENTRVNAFASYDFLKYLQENIDSDNNISIDYSSHFLQLSATGIPFQVDSEKRTSFKSDKHFYSFSKQRDAFYGLVREWQEKHSNPDFNLEKLINSRVSQIMICDNELNTYYEFAKLFIAQFLEMCRDTVGSKHFEIDTSDSTLLELKKRYPEKFKSLQDRLTQPLLTSNPCPTPSFSLAELFFYKFVQIVDSFYFNKYLVHILFAHITDLNRKSFGIENHSDVLFESDYAKRLWQDIQVVILELRLLAKFLGLIVFLPYKNVTYDNLDCFQNRDTVTESFKLENFIEEAYNNHHLLITIPWVVEFFSMADRYAFQLKKYQTPLRYLFELYCSQNMLIFNDAFNLLNLALLLHLGWLFEQPHVTIKIENVSLFNSTSNVCGIDDFVVVDKNFLYALCPFLSHTKKPLLDFSNGNRNATKCSFRKITPIRTNIFVGLDVIKNLKNQLLDSFFRYSSKRTKECLVFVTDRHFTNIKHYISEDLIPYCCEEVVNNIKNDFILDTEVTELDSLKLLNSTIYNKYLEEGKKLVALKCDSYLKRFLKEKATSSIESLFPESINVQFVHVAGKVVTHNVCLKVQEWLTANRQIYLHGVEILYNRYLKNLIKNSTQQYNSSLFNDFSTGSDSSFVC